VDIPDKVLEKRIHLAEVRERRGRARHFCCRGFLGIKSRSKSRSKSRAADEKWEKACPVGSAAGTTIE
jgi:hypothetical protein